MHAIPEIEFSLNEQYENEKGVFTVVSIDDDDMVIRWNNGEEVRTDIELQRRIQERRAFEEIQKQQKKEAEAKKAASKSMARGRKEFEGLQPTDFKNTSAGTQWRNRNQIGLSVTRKLPDNDLNINSWAVARKSEVNWLGTKQHSRKDVRRQAKFFVRLDTESLHYGLIIPRTYDENGVSRYWLALSDWLEHEENDLSLHGIALEKGMTVSEIERSIRFIPEEAGGWRIDGDKRSRNIDTLSKYIAALPDKMDMHLEIIKTVDKNEAVDLKKDIATAIAEVFAALLPVYQVSLIR